jgi:hypothetical protein
MKVLKRQATTTLVCAIGGICNNMFSMCSSSEKEEGLDVEAGMGWSDEWNKPDLTGLALLAARK